MLTTYQTIKSQKFFIPKCQKAISQQITNNEILNCESKKKTHTNNQIIKKKIIMLNRCEFIGHVCANPEVRNLEGGVKVATFSIGITKRGYTMQNGTTIPDKTTFVNIVAWRGLAEICEKYVQKGGQLFISGELSIRQYEKDGSKRIAAEVIAEYIELLGRKPESVSTEKRTNNVPVENDDKDDLPF